MSLENSYVLVLNNSWLPIGIKRLKEAISAIYENKDWQIVQIEDVNNEPLIQPVSWSEWISLDFNKSKKYIHTIRGPIRIPTVIIAKTYSRVNFRRYKPNKIGIYNRDKGICQYTGKKLNRKSCSIDHLIPKSRGGTNTWDNMVLCDKKINNKKGNKLPEEFSIKLINNPGTPGPIPMINSIGNNHKDWNYFITYNK